MAESTARPSAGQISVGHLAMAPLAREETPIAEPGRMNHKLDRFFGFVASVPITLREPEGAWDEDEGFARLRWPANDPWSLIAQTRPTSLRAASFNKSWYLCR